MYPENATNIIETIRKIKKIAISDVAKSLLLFINSYFGPKIAVVIPAACPNKNI